MIRVLGQRWGQAVMYGNRDGDGSNLCGDGCGWVQGSAETDGNRFQVCGTDGDGDKLSSPRSSLVSR